ncbi:MAG: hypothetical protein HOC09_05760 [Deltaproteobacteria bacterium]|jgi:hypothetical protein|nr:hypothetical protein [Deltaproteobacteria bacterium]
MADYISGSELLKQRNLKPFQLLDLIVNGELKPLDETGNLIFPPDIAWCQKKLEELYQRRSHYKKRINLTVASVAESVERTITGSVAISSPVIDRKNLDDIQSKIKSLKDLLDAIKNIDSRSKINLWKGFDYALIPSELRMFGYKQTLKEILFLLSGDSVYYEMSSGKDKETILYKMYCKKEHVAAILNTFKDSYLKGNSYNTFGPGHFVSDKSELGNEVNPKTKPIEWTGKVLEFTAFYGYLVSDSDYIELHRKGRKGEAFCDHFIMSGTKDPPKKSSFIRAQKEINYEEKKDEIKKILSRVL